MLDDESKVKIIFIIIAIIGIIKFFLKIKKFFNFKLPSKKIKKQVAEINQNIVIPRKKPGRVNITLEESWKFLTSITEAVMFKFSKPDQQSVVRIGTIIAQAGVVYQHVIELGIRSKTISSSSKEQNNSTKKQPSAIR
jgi:hypothetical protein